ncbi:MAG: methyltransferase [Clostridia bacterium]|nr:methyltransferase [Clostridia bacterium]
MTPLPHLHPDEKIEKVNENINLISKKDGLTFGTDAFLLAAYMGKAPSALAVDLGSGTGILPLLLLAKQKIKKAVAVEVQEAFGDLIVRNAALNQMSNKLELLRCDLRELPSKALPAENADFVLSNPPYMKADSGKANESEAKFIARHEICGGIGDFCRAAASLLKYGGKFYCVYRPDRLVDLFDAMRRNSLEPKRMTLVHATARSAPSIALVEAKKGASPSLILTRPLFLTKEDKVTQTEDTKRIYETCSFEDFLKV